MEKTNETSAKVEVKTIKEMSLEEITSEYNSLTGKKIKFTSRLIGEKALENARYRKNSGSNKLKVVKEKKEYEPDARAKAISATWADPKVREARGLRHGCEVNGTKYTSVYNAFKALSLPINKHIKFRKELKAKGTHSINGFTFSLIAVQKKAKKAEVKKAEVKKAEAKKTRETIASTTSTKKGKKNAAKK